MTMPWMRVDAAVRDHRKIRRLARRLGVATVTARGLVLGLWLRALSEEPDGTLSRWTPEDLLDATGADEVDIEPAPLAEALVDAGLLDPTPDGYLIHDWGEYSSSYDEARRRAERRKAAKPSESRSRVRGRSADGPGHGADGPRTAPGRSAACPDDRTGQDETDKTGPDGEGGAGGDAPLSLIPPEPPERVVCTLPAKPAGAVFHVTERLVADLAPLFPGVDIGGELRQLKAKTVTDASYRKTARGWPEAIRHWMRNAERYGGARRAGAVGRSAPARHGRTSGNVDAAQAFLDARRGGGDR